MTAVEAIHAGPLPVRRQKQLRDIVLQEGVVRLQDLCRRLGASPATIRRDLLELETHGRLRRVHGGAVSVEAHPDEPVFEDKAALAAREKRGIAGAALALVTPGSTVYLDGGSTVLELARLLAERTDVTVVTNSLQAAIELSRRGPRLILLGGQLRRLSQTLVGPLTQTVLDQLHVDLAFMGTYGLSPEQGLTTTDPDEAFTKRAVQARAGVVVVMADSRKLGTVSFARSGDLDDVDVLVTDRRADPKLLRALRKRIRKVILA